MLGALNISSELLLADLLISLYLRLAGYGLIYATICSRALVTKANWFYTLSESSLNFLLYFWFICHINSNFSPKLALSLMSVFSNTFINLFDAVKSVKEGKKEDY